MRAIAGYLVLLVATLHVWFLILEMFLWKKPLGRRIFRLSKEDAEITSVLASNQGLYNGFLATGLFTSFFLSDPASVFSFQVFFLSCVVVAGIYGAWTVNLRILWIQALPAAIALALVRG